MFINDNFKGLPVESWISKGKKNPVIQGSSSCVRDPQDKEPLGIKKMEREDDGMEREAEPMKGRSAAHSTSDVVSNPYIAKLPADVLYHLSLGCVTHNLPEMFSDVKYICMGGTPKRMEGFARYMKEELKLNLPAGSDIYDISETSHRYSMFKVGPVLSVSHGMGIPSLSILMHELLKLMHYAHCRDVTFIRLGTSGGIGIPAGSLVISNATVDARLKPIHKVFILGKAVPRPAVLDEDLAVELQEIARKYLPRYRTLVGKTMCSNDFYEGQARLDGAFCDYTEEDKMTYMKRLQRNGVCNIEMESLGFAAMCHHAGIKGAVICVTLLDRLQGDQVTVDKSMLEDWQRRPQELAAKFIISKESR